MTVLGTAAVHAMKNTGKLAAYSFVLLLALVSVGLPTPAAALIFTIDGNGNGIHELGGVDDIPFSFSGTTTTGIAGSCFVGSTTARVCGTIRAVSIYLSDSDIAAFVSSGGTFAGRDVLVFDVVLNTGSAVVDQIGVSVATNPIGLDPNGAGYLIAPGETTSPATGAGSITLSPGFGFFPGQYLFNYSLNALDAGNLSAGETTRRLFVTWADTGDVVKPLAIGQTATFMMSSGTDADFMVMIVPEPGTVSLVGAGLLAFALWRRQRG